MELSTLTPDLPQLLMDMGVHYDPERLAAALSSRPTGVCVAASQPVEILASWGAPGHQAEEILVEVGARCSARAGRPRPPFARPCLPCCSIRRAGGALGAGGGVPGRIHHAGAGRPGIRQHREQRAAARAAAAHCAVGPGAQLRENGAGAERWVSWGAPG